MNILSILLDDIVNVPMSWRIRIISSIMALKVIVTSINQMYGEQQTKTNVRNNLIYGYCTFGVSNLTFEPNASIVTITFKPCSYKSVISLHP